MSCRGLIERALIVIRLSDVVFHWREFNHWEGIIEHSRLLFVNARNFSVVTCSIHEEAVNIDTIFWTFLYLISLFCFLDLEFPTKQVNGYSVLSRMSL